MGFFVVFQKHSTGLFQAINTVVLGAANLSRYRFGGAISVSWHSLQESSEFIFQSCELLPEYTTTVMVGAKRKCTSWRGGKITPLGMTPSTSWEMASCGCPNQVTHKEAFLWKEEQYSLFLRSRKQCGPEVEGYGWALVRISWWSAPVFGWEWPWLLPIKRRVKDLTNVPQV